MASVVDRIDRVAREAFGFEALRPGQREAIESVLAGRDTLAVMPTGSGKSAIYQIAGLLTAGPTVVVSPLIALQRDQVEDLAERAAGRRRAAQLERAGVRARARARRAGRGRARVPVPGARAARQRGGAGRAGGRAARRCSSSTRRTASPSGATTSGPSTCGSAPRPRRSGARRPRAHRDGGAAGARGDRRPARHARPGGARARVRPAQHPPRRRALPRRAGRRAQARALPDAVEAAPKPGIVYVATRRHAERARRRRCASAA